MRIRLLLACVLGLLVATPPATADWDPGQPAKWVQLPDTSPMGIDVNASPWPRDYILADDFECRQQGPITDIHIWGSWIGDEYPFNDPGNVTFILSIHADIPADPASGEHSRPGQVLWWREFQPGTFSVRFWPVDVVEGWMDPPDQYFFPADWSIWQYNFFLDAADAFFQEGTPEQPVVYWLDVKALPQDPAFRFGWKTSLDHWNDDAVWGEGLEPYPGPWYELRYPPGHEMFGQSIDLAFVITGEEEPGLDFGDAPDPSYPTLLASAGANHLIVPGILMGNLIDAEPNGLPDPNAKGDDMSNLPDEDGVVWTSPLQSGQMATVDVTVSVGGFLNLWIDYGIDGSWDQAVDRVFADLPLPAGLNSLSFFVPAGTPTGTTFARFRFSTIQGLGVRGGAPDGEVEDYQVAITQPLEMDFGDAPDPTYPTLLASNGARHALTGGPQLGTFIDGEPDGQPDPNAQGDDLNGQVDEDGIAFPAPLVAGQLANVLVDVQNGPGLLSAWFDWAGDGSWAEPGDQVFTDYPVAVGMHVLTMAVPAAAKPGVTFCRFRLSTMGGLSFVGLSPDGEVEDYMVRIEGPTIVKYRQEPDLTPMGIDVACSPGAKDYILADDFPCTQTGPITDIHIWGSWLGDEMPFNDPLAVHFTLSIHADIPADQSPTGYSMPGELLWIQTFPPASFHATRYEAGIQEGWMDPPDQYFFPADTVCWQYDFYMPEGGAFIQEGDPTHPVVYWLDVKANPIEPNFHFGWKTSIVHWNDDAVWGEGLEPFFGPWNELRYPPGHELFPQSMDLAFMLTTNVEPPELDYGDVPDPTYPTLLASNGARHVIVPGFYLGAGVDGDPDGQPSSPATGDDNDGNDDEDGVVFTTPLRPNQMASIDVTASTVGMLDAWFDWNDDGDWADPGECMFSAHPLNPGLNTLTFKVPASAKAPTRSYARFRFSAAGALSYDGPASEGEVEDYLYDVEDHYILKWLQTPDLSPTGIDINASPFPDDYILADDFLCVDPMPLTDFRIWGSWLNDYLPFQEDPASVAFTLSIHADIPAADSPTGYSMPGEMLWMRDFGPGEFVVEPFMQGIEEGWMDPPDQYWFPADTICWLYSFHVDPHYAFHQEGSEAAPVVYWLDVKARPMDPEAVWGWKTSLDHWNDDGVWSVGPEGDPGLWRELRYPPMHQLADQSIDLAFALYYDTVTATDPVQIPGRTQLKQNVPNPFNPRTEISYSLPAGGGQVSLVIYDAMGRRIRTLVDGVQGEGPHTVMWDGCDDDGRAMPSGVYFYRLVGPNATEAKKMLMIR